MLTCADCQFGSCNFNCKKCKYVCSKRRLATNKNGTVIFGGKCFHAADAKNAKCAEFKQIED